MSTPEVDANKISASASNGLLDERLQPWREPTEEEIASEIHEGLVMLGPEIVLVELLP